MHLSYGGYGYGLVGARIIGDRIHLALSREARAQTPYPLWRGRWARTEPLLAEFARCMVVSVPLAQWYPDHSTARYSPYGWSPAELAAWLDGVQLDGVPAAHVAGPFGL